MAVQEEFESEVRIIGMAGATDSPSAVEAFVSGTNSDGLTHIPDYDGSIWEQFGVGHRSYLYIDDDGSTSIGGYDSLRQGVERLIAE